MFLRDGRKLVALVGLVAVLGVGAAACGEDDDGGEVRETGSDASSGSGSGSGSASGVASGSGSEAEECVLVGNSTEEPTAAVQVDLSEFVISPIPAEVPAGIIQFVAINAGEEAHEVVIARFDGEPGDLPVDDEGAADETQLPEDAVIGEIEGFAGGHTCAGAFDLEPGDYVLFCNIVEEEDDGTHEAHYDEGMTVAFTVT